jgi:XTP/dITP diphosphohydrolase
VLTVLLTSPRVAPGLLSWDAWSALRAASRVLAGSADHPQLPALVAAGVLVEVIDADRTVLGAELSAAVGADGTVVWLAPPGAVAAAPVPGVLPGSFLVLDGAPDLPGAHLLDLVSIMDKLRVSCPWDREQTHESLLKYLLEEAYEAAETIETGDLSALREEIGDVMFQAFFHARIAAERPVAEGGFTIDDVADTLAAKLVRRHPHVFGSVTVSSAAEVNANWEEIKKAERAAKAGPSAAPSILDGVPFGQPALSLAAQVRRRAARAGIMVPMMPSAEPLDGGEPDSASGSRAGFGGSKGGGAPLGNRVPLGENRALTGDELGAGLMALVARAAEAGLDPEAELRAAVRRYATTVREQEHARVPGEAGDDGASPKGPVE